MPLAILDKGYIPKIISALLILLSFGCCQSQNVKKENMKYNELTPEEQRVIVHKGTEMPFTGLYEKHYKEGTYLCKRCDAPLYRSTDKFDSGCGWPSFDDEIKGAVKRVPDADGRRTEILCANCGGHLGHVFLGEGFTDKNTRHCVNSISLKFEDAKLVTSGQGLQKAYFAGGCFWGVEHFFEKAQGVKSAVSGYMGGHVQNPDYKIVCTGQSGHAEVVEVTFDPSKIGYENLAKLFFEIHDFTQVNRQGPDVGEQYRSEIFYIDKEQKQIAEKLIKILTDKGYKVATKITKSEKFYEAEDYHQDYYYHKGTLPYCHVRKKVF